MRTHPSRQRDLFDPLRRAEALPRSVRTKLRPLLLALLAEAVGRTNTASVEAGDDQDHR
jgi:hypothetical protein